jgi:hypothetical protein
MEALLLFGSTLHPCTVQDISLAEELRVSLIVDPTPVYI